MCPYMTYLPGFIISPLTKITVYSYHRRTPSVLCHPLESSSRKMASTSEEGTHWAQVIFTYDSRPPVLIDKEQITLGRKEGKRTGYERQSIVKNDYFTLWCNVCTGNRSAGSVLHSVYYMVNKMFSRSKKRYTL